MQVLEAADEIDANVALIGHDESRLRSEVFIGFGVWDRGYGFDEFAKRHVGKERVEACETIGNTWADGRTSKSVDLPPNLVAIARHEPIPWVPDERKRIRTWIQGPAFGFGCLWRARKVDEVGIPA